MAVPIWLTKMRIYTEFGRIALLLLTVLEIFDDESLNSTFRNK